MKQRILGQLFDKIRAHCKEHNIDCEMEATFKIDEHRCYKVSWEPEGKIE